MPRTRRPNHLKLIHSNEIKLVQSNETKQYRLFSKEEFIQLKDDGYTNEEIAEKYGIPEIAVFKIANFIYSDSL